MTVKIPNIFDYATSELSQDAFLAWFIEWSKPELKGENAKLNELSTLFVQKLIGDTTEIKEVEIKKQEKNIDLLILLNKKYAIVIEDKINTKEHSKQLERYKETVETVKAFEGYDFVGIYYKIENEAKREIEHYTRICRENMLKILNNGGEYSPVHPILHQYYEKLREKETKTNSFNENSPKDWDDYAWQGFYLRVHDHFKNDKFFARASWHKVNNPKGGFWGFWWAWNSINENRNSINKKNSECYLQFESNRENTLVFKLSLNETDKGNYNVWDSYLEAIKEVFPEAQKCRKKNGEYMSVAEMNIFNDEKVFSISETLKNLQEITQKMESIAKRTTELYLKKLNSN